MQVVHCFKLIAHFHDNHLDDVIPLLCKHFVGSHVLTVAMAAQSIIINKIKTKVWLDVVLLQQLIQNLPPVKYHRLIEHVYKVLFIRYCRCTKILGALNETKESPMLECSRSECNYVCI